MINAYCSYWLLELQFVVTDLDGFMIMGSCNKP